MSIDVSPIPQDNLKILVCCGTGCTANGGREVYRAFKEELKDHPEFEVLPLIKATGCNGWCEKGPLIRLMPRDITYCSVRPEDVPEIVNKTLTQGIVIKRLLYRDPVTKEHISSHLQTGFYRKQHKIALRNIGEIDPGEIHDYLERDGYKALEKTLKSLTPAQVVGELKKSDIRGRGGAGFPTGMKWSFIPKGSEHPVYLCCNADESEPGTCKDRIIIEQDPHKLLEGILIACYAIGSHQAYIYIRGEFHRGAQILQLAIEDARRNGLIGRNILDSGFDCGIEVYRGAGAYICGEETGLLTSLEGQRGYPRNKPPFPAIAGLYGSPTIINNVETLAAIPVIIDKGGEWYARFGTEKSRGTRLLCLSGHVNRPGVYEVEMGTMTLREFIMNFGGGIPGGRKIKAVIPGGSSMPVLRENQLDVKLTFEDIQAIGSSLGSGAVIVMDETVDMVETALLIARFYEHESCVPSRQEIGRAHV